LRVSGASELVLTNLDVLRGFTPLKLGVAYRLADGMRTTELPAFDLEHAVPEFVELPGFSEDLREVRTFAALPKNAQAYVQAIEQHESVSAGESDVEQNQFGFIAHGHPGRLQGIAGAEETPSRPMQVVLHEDLEVLAVVDHKDTSGRTQASHGSILLGVVPPQA